MMFSSPATYLMTGSAEVTRRLPSTFRETVEISCLRASGASGRMAQPVGKTRDAGDMLTTSVSLLERLRRPDPTQAWNRFVDLYTPILFHWARRAGLQPQDAADLVQDTFATLIQKLPEFDYQPGRSFRGWLRTILMNKWRNCLRRKGLEPGAAKSGELSGLAGGNNLEEFWEDEHRQHLVRRALELMQADFESKTWKACWGLVVEGRSGTDLAKELGLSENAVYLAKWRVLRRLREELDGVL